MSKLQRLLAMSALAMSAAAARNPYDIYPQLQDSRTYGDVPNPDTRQLREFNVKGHRIMAYSRKDAISRLKHQKKISK